MTIWRAPQPLSNSWNIWRLAHAGSPGELFFIELRTDIAADRQELETLIAGLQVSQSRTHKATSWLAEKVTELKLRWDDPAGGTLRIFEAVEAVAIGIDGKRVLWQALAAAEEDAPGLRLADYERLTQRAEEQRRRLEGVRLEAAKAALGAV